MRPRNKTAEIGPEFRFTSHLQIERLMDKLQRDVGLDYKIEDVNGKTKRGQSNDKALKEFIATGKFKNLPGISPEDFDDDNDY